MLIDLEFSLESAESRINKEYIKEFDTSDGGLKITADLPEGKGETKEFTLVMAKREAKGIYWSHGLDNTIKDYCDWDVNHAGERLRVIWKKLEDAKPEDKEPIRKKLNEELEVSDYGVADDLDQVLEYGKRFVDSDDPYVLSICGITQEHSGGFRWHKNGVYIGKHKNRGEHLYETPEIDNIIVFEFLKLIPKKKS